MRQALDLAICSGMDFQEGDIENLCLDFDGGRWLGDMEPYYHLACCNNENASVEIENYLGRDPLFVVGVEYFAGMGFTTRRSRLACGASFFWGKYIAVVKSIEKESVLVNLFSPMVTMSFGERKITREDLAKDFPESAS